MLSRRDAIVGCLLGTAVGDAMGLPYEGLSKRRRKKMFPQISDHRFFFGKGMISDDTEHSCMVAQSLIVASGDIDRFVADFAWRMRFWLAGLPAGIGYATLRAILKLWMGYSGKDSGVHSAGNGPAMRSAILGIYSRENVKALVRACTRITHTDPKAEHGALAVALAASNCSNEEFITSIHRDIADPELVKLLEKAMQSLDISTELFATGCGAMNAVSGYVYQTVPVAIHAALRNRDNFRDAILEVISCGGDTDTTAAITGGVVGAHVGKEGIPVEWLENLRDWPRSTSWIEQLGNQLADGNSTEPLGVPPVSVLIRNAFFTAVVFAHGFRRLFPPY